MTISKKQPISQYDKMANTGITKLLIGLSIPTIITMLVTNIYNMADTAFVGQLGTSASGAVGVVFGFMAILQAVAFMFGQGAGALLSRKLGARDAKGASALASTGLFFALVISVVAAVICFLFLTPLVRFLGSTPTIEPFAKTYIAYILLAAPFTVGGFVLNNILRYEGKASLGMVGLVIGAALNIAGDPILMFGLHMDIAGAGLSTCISQVISFFILLMFFLKGKTQCRLSIRLVIWRPKEILDIITTGLPSLIRQGLQSLAVVFLNMMAAAYGDEAIAAMSIVSRIIFFVFSVALGIGQGFQPISSFSYGARKYKRLRDAYWTTFLLSQILIVLISIVVFLFAPSVVALFRNDPDVIRIGIRPLQLQLAAQLCLPITVVTEMVLQTTGRKWQASLLSSLKSGLIFIPLLLIMAKCRGLAGIQEAQPIAYVVMLPLALIFARKFFREIPKEDEKVPADQAMRR